MINKFIKKALIIIIMALIVVCGGISAFAADIDTGAETEDAETGQTDGTETDFPDSPRIDEGDILSLPNISVNIGGETADGEPTGSSSVQLLLLLTIISLAPSILIMMTAFTRIVIMLHFVRSALGTQQMPPNQVIIGLAIFLTWFIMNPVLQEVNTNAIQPYSAGEISQQQMVDEAMAPIRGFMFSQVEDKDLALFMELSGEEYSSREEISSSVLIPAFIIGEMTKGFIFGFMIYMPFIVIDMVVASVLMAMGMMMLPPAMISLPFKILLFVMVDGWTYVVEVLASTFN